MTGTSKKSIQYIPLGDIGEGALTRFSLDPAPEALVQSIRELGITHPVLLAPKDKTYQIVCGHRRIECARLLQFEPCRCLCWTQRPHPRNR
jgi:ParB-like chromosome segregation protein Spo0J